MNQAATATKPAPAKSKVAKAWAHPTRVKAFRELADGVYSPSELAVKLGIELHSMSYHVRELEKLGLVEVVREQQVRGAVQHFFRAVERPEMSVEEWAALTPAERRPLSQYLLGVMLGEIDAADEGGTFDARPGRILNRVPIQADEQGFDEIQSLLEETLDRVQDIHGAIAARGAAETFPVRIGLMSFEMPVR